MKISRIFYCFCSLLLAFNAYAAELNISVDKKVIPEGDILSLVVEYTGSEGKAPDFSDLSKDFTIVSNSTSKRFNFINGNMTYSTQWRIGLQPNKVGKIVIGPLKIDNLISNQIEVDIKEMSDIAYVPDRRENSNAPYFQITQSADILSPYVQQQVVFLVNVYDSIGLQNGGVFINEEAKKDWIIVPLLSEPIIKQDVINNKHVNIASYLFAAFPQKSGEISAPIFSFDGYYIKNSSFKFPNFSDDIDIFGVDFHNILGQKIPVKMRTKPETVEVKPIPSQFRTGTWLPANNLKVSTSWSVKNGFKVGEAVTRTIDLTAVGVTESMLPQIKFDEIDGVRQYPEQPEISEYIDKGQVVTAAKINNVYIPTKSGTITIPETPIKWFNVKTNKEETAIIPEDTLFVVSNPAMVEAPSDNKVESEVSDDNKQNNDIATNKIEESSHPDTTFLSAFSKYRHLLWIGFVFLVGFVVTAIYFASAKKRHFYRNFVIKTIKQHDYQKAKEAIIEWARDKFYPDSINNFNDIVQHVQNKEFSDQLSCLNKFLYSSNSDFFDGSKFIEIFKKIDTLKKDKKKNTEVLPNLYD